MPRRIRLDFAPEEGGRCDLTGEADEVVVRGYRTRPSDANYSAWRHPMTPYYKVKTTELEWVPLHPQPERMGYRHWPGTIVASKDGLRQPATIVRTAERRLHDLSHRHARLWAAGYDMDNMKPRGFVESEMPLARLVGARWQDDFAAGIRSLVEKAREVASLLGSAVRQALWGGEAPGSDKGDRQLAAERFWAHTEASFLDIVEDLALALDRAENGEQVRATRAEAEARWREALTRQALAVFDALVPLDVTIEELRVMERRIAARRRLVFGLREPAAGATGKTKGKGRKAA
jgi:CRISPR system Cascade subunit CasA